MTTTTSSSIISNNIPTTTNNALNRRRNGSGSKNATAAASSSSSSSSTFILKSSESKSNAKSSRCRGGVIVFDSSFLSSSLSKKCVFPPRRLRRRRAYSRLLAKVSATKPPQGGGGGNEAKKNNKNYRFTILSLVALALLLCNADRVIMSIVGLPMSKMNGWDVKVLGLIQSSFLFGYALTPIFGGVLADKIGGARVLLGGLLVWSLATMVTPLAASTKSIPLLCLCRVVMGLGEGVALPCMNNVASRWVPKFERSRAVSFCMGGFQSGSMIGLLVAPLLMSRFGIAGPFYVFGAIGVAWAALWNARATSYPRANERVGEEELKFIEDGGAIVDHLRSSSSESSSSSSGKEIDDEVVVVTEVEKKTTPWKMLLSHPATWACVVANFVNNFGFFILLAWMPKYFNDVVKLNLATSSWFSALPWATMAVSGVFAGILADRMLSEWKVSTATTRKFIQIRRLFRSSFMFARLRSERFRNHARVCFNDVNRRRWVHGIFSIRFPRQLCGDRTEICEHYSRRREHGRVYRRYGRHIRRRLDSFAFGGERVVERHVHDVCDVRRRCPRLARVYERRAGVLLIFFLQGKNVLF